MKTLHGLTSALAILGVASVAVGQDVPRPTPGSQVSMCVTTAIGECGNPCEPFQCMPNFTFVSSGEVMAFTSFGAPGTAYVLFAGASVQGCLPVPGIAGELAAWTPALPVHIGIFGASFRSELFCSPAQDVFDFAVPQVAPGFAVRFQVLGVNEYLMDWPTLTFSRATEVLTR